MFRFILVAVVMLCSAGSSRADLIFTIGSDDGPAAPTNLTFTAGSNASVAVYVHNDLLATTLTGQNFTLAFDIALPGASSFRDGHTSSIAGTFSNFTALLPLAGTTGVTQPMDVNSSTNSTFGYDLLVDFSPATQFTFPPNGTQSTATKIGTISFQIDSSTAPGTYGFKFADAARYSDDTSLANDGPNGVTLAAGGDGIFYNRFSVSAVPEPSSFLLASCVICGFALRRSRKSRLKV